MPEPVTLDNALTAPLTYSLGEAWSGLRPVIAAPGADWRQLGETLERLLV